MTDKEKMDMLALIKEAMSPMNERFDKIDERLNKMDDRLDVIEENTKITRVAANALVGWAEKVESVVHIPLHEKNRK